MRKSAVVDLPILGDPITATRFLVFGGFGSSCSWPPTYDIGSLLIVVMKVEGVLSTSGGTSCRRREASRRALTDLAWLACDSKFFS
jgi:hypothetical protein